MVLTHGSNEASIQLSPGAAVSSESSAEGRYVLKPIMWSPEGPSVMSSLNPVKVPHNQWWDERCKYQKARVLGYHHGSWTSLDTIRLCICIYLFTHPCTLIKSSDLMYSHFHCSQYSANAQPRGGRRGGKRWIGECSFPKVAWRTRRVTKKTRRLAFYFVLDPRERNGCSRNRIFTLQELTF